MGGNRTLGRNQYVLGLYELYGRLTSDFPEVLFESCAGGGGRFDPGLLAFAPQAWASDDSDAIERLAIQWGTSFFYPTSSIGAHVSAEDRRAIAEDIAFYKDWRSVFQFGAFHRLRGRRDADGNEVAWMSVSADRRRAAVLRVQTLAMPNPPSGRLRLRGGDELMNVGLLLGGDGWEGIRRGDFASWIFTLEADAPA